MKYNITCTGIDDYYKYFPFEEKFTSCSTSNPKSISDCTNYEMEDNSKCCLATIEKYDDVFRCYSTIGLISNNVTYTTSFGDKIILLCDSYFQLLRFKYFISCFIIGYVLFLF